MIDRQYLKGTYYENHTFPACSHTHTNFESHPHDFLGEICISESTRLQLPNECVSFGAPSYVGRGRKGAHLNISSHFPVPLQTEHSLDFVEHRTAAMVPPAGGGDMEEKAELPFGGSPAALARGARRQLNSRSTFPFSSMSRYNMDFRVSMPKFLSPNSQPWPR